MDDHDEIPVEQQLADLANLKQVTRRRESLRRGSPEWIAAIEAEQRAADRVRKWTHPVTQVRSGSPER